MIKTCSLKTNGKCSMGGGRHCPGEQSCITFQSYVDIKKEQAQKGKEKSI